VLRQRARHASARDGPAFSQIAIGVLGFVCFIGAAGLLIVLNTHRID
jgi:hypothetical protein